MTDETTTNPLIMAGELITGPGLYQARCGDLVQITRWRAGWWVSEWKGIRTDYHSDGRKRLRTEADAGRWDLLHWVAPLPASEPEPETTTEQLAEIEGQAESTPATEYTPPEGWRVLRYGELLQPGDQWVNWEGTQSRPDIQHGDGATVSGGRYIRNIDIELQAVKAQLEAVKAELAQVLKDRYALQIELDAAQQVPADSPELRQLRADLEQMTLGRDTYRDGYNRVLSDLETARETAKAEAVEAIVEWLQAFRGCNSPSLALLLLEALPSIMRSLTGLEDEDIE